MVEHMHGDAARRLTGRGTDCARLKSGAPAPEARSVSAVIHSWLERFCREGERDLGVAEIVKTALRLSSGEEPGEFDDLAGCGQVRPVPVRIGDTVMVVARQVLPDVRQTCQRIRARNLSPVVILDNLVGGSEARCAPSSPAEREFDVLHLDQFVTAIVLKRAWRDKADSGDVVTDLIGRCSAGVRRLGMA